MDKTLHPETLAVHAGWNGDPALGVADIDQALAQA